MYTRSKVHATLWFTIGILAVSCSTAGTAAAGSFSTGVFVLPATTLAFTVPDLPNSEVQPSDALNGLVVCPDSPSPIPASQLVMTVRNSDNVPVVNGQVEVILGANHTLCPGADFTTTTDENGVASLTLAASGCSHEVALAGQIKVNGVTIRAYENVKSPDYDGASGDGSSNIADLIDFSNEFLGASISDCHDYNNDGETGLDDLIIFSQAFENDNHCP